MKKELWEIHKRLERLEGEFSDLRNILNEYFTKEEQVILRYEASIGRNGTKLEEVKGEERIEYAASCQKYLKFGNEVEDCLADRLPRSEAVWVGASPQALVEIGYEKKDMYITQKHIRNILHSSTNRAAHQHDIEIKQFRQLPELLKEPLAIAKVKKRNETMVIVLDAKDSQGNQLIVPIKKDGCAYYKEKKIEANFILSTYGKKNIAAYLTRAAIEGEILFINKNISTKLGQVPLQLRQFLSTGTYINMIQHSSENVNVSDEKMTLKNEGLDIKNPIKKL